MKTLYLLLKRYRSMALSELSMLFLVWVLALSFAYTMCYAFEASAKLRYVERTFDNNAVVFIFDEEFRDDLLQSDQLEFQNLSERPLWRNAREEIMKVTEAEGLSRLSQLPITIDGWAENPLRGRAGGVVSLEGNIYRNLISYDPLTLRNYPISVSEGRWFTDAEAGGIVCSENTEIPVILGKDWDSCYAVGDVIEARVDDLDISSQTTDDYHVPKGTLRLRVIGRFSGDAYIYMMNDVTLTPFDGLFMKATISDITTPFVIAPELIVDGTRADTQTWTAFSQMTCFVFKEDAEASVTEWNAGDLRKYGRFSSLTDIARQDQASFQEGSKSYIVHLIMSGLMLLASVFGYNLLLMYRQKKTWALYYALGMSWRKGLALSLAGNLLVFVVAGLAGTACGIWLVNEVRAMSADTNAIACAVTMAGIALLYLISSVIAARLIARTDPSQILGGN